MNFTEQEQDYYELIIDMLDDGTIEESERSLLNKRKDKYGISDERAKEIEDSAFQEIQNKNKPKFNTEGEKEYYELLEDMLEDGIIGDSERTLLNKRKVKYGISDERAKEFEDYIKSVKGINDTVSDSSSKVNAKDLFEQGKSYINDENYEEAIKCFKKAVELEPNNTYNWGLLGASYMHNGNYRESIECLDKSVELNQNIADHWNWFGRCHYMICKFEKAIKCFKKAVELEPNDADNWYFLGRSYNQNGNYEEAIRCLNDAVKLAPHYANNWYWLGRSYNQNNNYEEAIKYFKKVEELNPSDADNWYCLSNFYYKNGNYEEAIRCSKKAKELEHYGRRHFWFLADSYNELGDSYREIGKFEEAKNAYTRALEIKPNDAYAKEKLKNITSSFGIFKDIGKFFK